MKEINNKNIYCFCRLPDYLPPTNKFYSGSTKYRCSAYLNNKNLFFTKNKYKISRIYLYFIYLYFF